MLPNEFVRRELEREWEAVARDEKKVGASAHWRLFLP